jgi:hypothetical protein
VICETAMSTTGIDAQRPPARVWAQLQRTHSDGPLIAMNVTDDAARAEEWRRM